MDTKMSPGITLVAVGVLIIVLSRAFNLGSPWPLVLSVTGTVVVVWGAVTVYRTRRSTPD